MKKISILIFILSLSIGFFALYIQDKQKKVVQVPQVQNITPTSTPMEVIVTAQQNTGLIIQPTPTGIFIPTVETAVRIYLPIKLSTATVTFNYKKNDLQIEFCGKKEIVMTEFMDFLDNNQINRAFFNEDDVIFIDNGKCP